MCEEGEQGEGVVEEAVTGGVKYTEPVHCFACVITIVGTFQT